jgi:hypothetical protein
MFLNTYFFRWLFPFLSPLTTYEDIYFVPLCSQFIVYFSFSTRVMAFSPEFPKVTKLSLHAIRYSSAIVAAMSLENRFDNIAH